MTVPGPAFAAAIRRILPPRQVRGLGTVTLSPGPAGALRLTWNLAHEDVPASGRWADMVLVSARYLRAIPRVTIPATYRVTFFGGLLAINGATIAATALASEAPPAPAEAPPAPKVPASWFNTPLGRNERGPA